MTRLANSTTRTQSSASRVGKRPPKEASGAPARQRKGRRLGKWVTSSTVSKSPREQRWAMREELWRISSLKAVRQCGKVPIKPLVTLRAGANGAHSGIGGLSTCGSQCCPVCSAKIARRRREEVNAIVKKALAEGLHVSMLTLTMRHHKGQSMEHLWKALADGWKFFISGPRYQQFREQLGMRGFVKSVEYTYSAKFGHHLHVHALIITEKNPRETPLVFQRKQGRRKTPYPPEIMMPAKYVAQRWEKGIAKHGVTFIADRGGLDWDVARDAAKAGSYVAKLGGLIDGGERISNEMTLSAFKRAKVDGNFTPFQLLQFFLDTGDMDMLKLWHAWEQGSKGKRFISFSQGLREWAKLGKEQTDEEIAAEEAGDDVIAAFNHEQWKQVIKHGVFQLLERTDRGGKIAAYNWLRNRNIEFLIPTDEQN